MDPILEEMRRVKAVSEIRESRYRFWITYLTDRLASLEAELSQKTDASQTPAKRKVSA